VVRFDPGAGVAVVGDGVTCLVLDDPGSDLVTQLRTALVDGDGTDSALDVMVRAAGLDLPPFGLVVAEGDQTRVVVRGLVTAVVEGSAGSVDLMADRMRTWLEHVADDVSSVRLVIDGAATGGPLSFEASGGVVPAGVVEIVAAPQNPSVGQDGTFNTVPPPLPTALVGGDPDGSVDDDSSGEPIIGGMFAHESPHDVSVEYQSAEDMSVEDGPAVDPALEDLAGDVLTGDVLAVDGPPHGEPNVNDPSELTRYEPEPIGWADSAEAEVLPELSTDPDEPFAPPTVEDDEPEPPFVIEQPASESTPDDPSTFDPSIEVDHGATLVVPFDDAISLGLDDPAEDGPDPAAPLPPTPVVLDGPPSIGSVDALHPGVESADSSGPATADDYDHLFGATQFRTVEQAAVRPDDDPGQDPAGAPMISGVPSGNDTITPPSDDSDPLAGDHDGHTVSLASLRAQLAQSAPTPGSSPSVHAVQCPAGHLNPTHAGACRVCGAAIDDQEHVSVPRPVLGTLTFTDGRVVTVSGPLIIGRSPKVEGVLTGEAPELVKVSSPLKEVSSSHLEVRLEGWQVLVVDRQSTNGTVVTAPGRDPQRLRPGEPVPITPGTTVNLADEAEFVFEASV